MENTSKRKKNLAHKRGMQLKGDRVNNMKVNKGMSRKGGKNHAQMF